MANALVGTRVQRAHMLGLRWRQAGGAVILALMLPQAYATNGYFAHGYSAAQSAMGGAGTALTEDALITTINPAGAVWVADRVDVNLGFFVPVRNYQASERGSGAQQGIFTIDPAYVRSGHELFGIPAVSAKWSLDDESAWGITMYGNGGMNTDYRGNSARFAQGMQLAVGPATLVNFETQCEGTFGGGEPVQGAQDPQHLCGYGKADAGVDLIQLFVAPFYSRKLGDRSSIGIEPILAAQRFQAHGLNAFAKFSNAPDKVSDNSFDYSYGAGARIGFLTGIVPGIGIGASYQSRVWMTRLKRYAGLFAGEGGFDIPSSWNVGLSVHPTSDQRIAFDYQRINFSEVRSVGNDLDPNAFINGCAIPELLSEFVAANPVYGALITPPPKDPSTCLGARTGPGFGWQDVNVYKLGYQIRFAAFKFRIGYSQTHQPIPTSQVLFNVLAPAVIDRHYTAGMSYQFSQTLGFDVALMYAQRNPVVGKNPLSNTNATAFDLAGFGSSTAQAFGPDPNDQDLTLNMHQFEAVLGLTYYFQ